MRNVLVHQYFGIDLEEVWNTVLVDLPQLKPLFLTPAYEHDRYGTQPADILRHFDAFTSSFDSADDDNGDGIPDTLGIPQWVAYEIRWHEGPLKSEKRPNITLLITHGVV